MCAHQSSLLRSPLSIAARLINLVRWGFVVCGELLSDSRCHGVYNARGVLNSTAVCYLHNVESRRFSSQCRLYTATLSKPFKSICRSICRNICRSICKSLETFKSICKLMEAVGSSRKTFAPSSTMRLYIRRD